MMRLAGYTVLSTQMAGTALLLLVLLAAHDAPLATASGSHASARKMTYFPDPEPSGPDGYSTADCCFVVNGVRLDCREVCNPSRPRPLPHPRPRPPRPRPGGDDQISRQCVSQGEEMADIAKDAACARLNLKCRQPSDFLPSDSEAKIVGYIDDPQPAPRGISDACRSLMESACVQAAMARVTGDCRAFLAGWADCADQTINPLYSFRNSLEDDFCVV